jgi:histidine ammonia-lyase
MAAYHAIRRRIPHLETDRILADDISVMRRMIRDGIILEAVESAVGPVRLPATK